MLRIEVTEIGRTPLPPIDLDDDELVIGSGERCRLRLPALAVRPSHLRLRQLARSPLRLGWTATHALELDGQPRLAGASGEAEAPVRVVIAGYQLRISEAPAASLPSPPQRTESLARELIRNIMGGVAPRLVVEAGPELGSSRMLAPPDSRLTVGRGDEADWVILDEGLSRVHAALLRTWDGVRVVDLGSKNGTTVDGQEVPGGADGQLLRDGARVALGDVALRYHDAAEHYLPDADADAEGDGDAGSRAGPRVAAEATPATTRSLAGGAPAPLGAARSGSTTLTILGVAVAAVALLAALWLLTVG